MNLENLMWKSDYIFFFNIVNICTYFKSHQNTPQLTSVSECGDRRELGLYVGVRSQ